MGWYGNGMGFGAWMFMGAFWVVLLGLLVLLVVWLLPTARRPGAGTGGGAPAGGEAPEEILDRRFARGEIDEPAYTAQRAALTAHRGQRR